MRSNFGDTFESYGRRRQFPWNDVTQRSKTTDERSVLITKEGQELKRIEVDVPFLMTMSIDCNTVDRFPLVYISCRQNWNAYPVYIGSAFQNW